MAIAPPPALSRSGSAPVSASQVSGTGANASLTSNAPMSPMDRPDFFSALRVAGMGAVSMITGSSAASTAVCTRASGVRPSSRALSEVIISTAAAPSLICEALPAWMTPPSLKAGLSPASFSGLVPRRRPSSAASTWPSGSSTGAIWPASRPSSVAAASLACEALENSSSWSRDRPHFSAIISAPMPWLNVTP